MSLSLSQDNEAGGYCDADGNCYDSSGNIIPKQGGTLPNVANTQSKIPSSGPQKDQVNTPSNSLNPKDKWYTGDKKQYYLPTSKSSAVYQNFTADGKPTGYYYDKDNGRMF
jgi:hypothetical protein